VQVGATAAEDERVVLSRLFRILLSEHHVRGDASSAGFTREGAHRCYPAGRGAEVGRSLGGVGRAFSLGVEGGRRLAVDRTRQKMRAGPAGGVENALCGSARSADSHLRRSRYPHLFSVWARSSPL